MILSKTTRNLTIALFLLSYARCNMMEDLLNAVADGLKTLWAHNSKLLANGLGLPRKNPNLTNPRKISKNPFEGISSDSKGDLEKYTKKHKDTVTHMEKLAEMLKNKSEESSFDIEKIGMMLEKALRYIKELAEFLTPFGTEEGDDDVFAENSNTSPENMEKHQGENQNYIISGESDGTREELVQSNILLYKLDLYEALADMEASYEVVAAK